MFLLFSYDDWLNGKVEEESISTDLTNSGKTFADILSKNAKVKERPKGSNRGPEVDRYVKTAGLNPENGYPWCMAFVYTMFDDFTRKMSIKNPLIKTAGVLDHWNNADRSLKININDILDTHTELINIRDELISDLLSIYEEREEYEMCVILKNKKEESIKVKENKTI